jgi:hypothetical protein
VFEGWKARREAREDAAVQKNLDEILADLERATVELAGVLDALRAENPSIHDEESFNG